MEVLQPKKYNIDIRCSEKGDCYIGTISINADSEEEVRDAMNEAIKVAVAGFKDINKKMYSEEGLNKEAPSMKEGKSRIRDIMEKYPRAYESWDLKEEETLIAGVKGGKSDFEIAKELQRQPSGIIFRIEKLKKEKRL